MVRVEARLGRAIISTTKSIPKILQSTLRTCFWTDREEVAGGEADLSN